MMNYNGKEPNLSTTMRRQENCSAANFIVVHNNSRCLSAINQFGRIVFAKTRIEIMPRYLKKTLMQTKYLIVVARTQIIDSVVEWKLGSLLQTTDHASGVAEKITEGRFE